MNACISLEKYQEHSMKIISKHTQKSNQNIRSKLSFILTVSDTIRHKKNRHRHKFSFWDRYNNKNVHLSPEWFHIYIDLTNSRTEQKGNHTNCSKWNSLK